MNNSPEKIPDNLIAAIIIHIFIGWGFLYIVKCAVGHLMNNAYLGLLPSIPIILPFIWFAYDLARLYPNMSITTIYCRVFGNIIGKICGIIFLLYLTFFLTIALRDSKLMVYSYFFERFPFFLITALFLAISLYPALKGVKSVGRLAAFMLIPPILAILILELLGLSNINPLNIRPVFTGFPGQWVSAGINLTLILIPVTAIYVYMPYLNRPKSIIKISLYSLIVVLPLFFLGLLGAIGVFGPSLTELMGWSIVEFFHIIDFPFLLLEQAGLFFLIAWLPFHFVGISQGLFIIGNDLNLIFPRIKRSWFIVAIGILAFILVNLRYNIINIEFLLDKFNHLISFFYLGLLFITWLVARLTYWSKKKV